MSYREVLVMMASICTSLAISGAMQRSYFPDWALLIFTVLGAGLLMSIWFSNEGVKQ